MTGDDYQLVEVLPGQLPLFSPARPSTRVGKMHRGLVLAPDQVYVGRPTGGVDPRAIAPGVYGCFGNPFPMPRVRTRDDEAECLRLYRQYLADRTSKDQAFARAVRQLAGKELLCWCVERWHFGQGGPVRCHGQILAEMAELPAR